MFEIKYTKTVHNRAIVTIEHYQEVVCILYSNGVISSDLQCSVPLRGLFATAELLVFSVFVAVVIYG